MSFNKVTYQHTVLHSYNEILFSNTNEWTTKPHRKYEFILNAYCAKSLESCPTHCGPMDLSLPGSWILQVRTLEWVATSSSRGSSPPRDRTHVSYVSCIGRRVLYHWATREASNLIIIIISEALDCSWSFVLRLCRNFDFCCFYSLERWI